MENAEMEIVRFDNADVIATSGGLTQFIKIFNVGDSTGNNLLLEYYEGNVLKGSQERTDIDTPQKIDVARWIGDKVGEEFDSNTGIFLTAKDDSISVSNLYTYDKSIPSKYGVINGTYEWVKNDHVFVQQQPK